MSRFAPNRLRLERDSFLPIRKPQDAHTSWPAPMVRHNAPTCCRDRVRQRPGQLPAATCTLAVPSGKQHAARRAPELAELVQCLEDLDRLAEPEPPTHDSVATLPAERR